MLDVQVSGGCVTIILDEVAAAGLVAVLGSWLAGISDVPGVEIG